MPVQRSSKLPRGIAVGVVVPTVLLFALVPIERRWAHTKGIGHIEHAHFGQVVERHIFEGLLKHVRHFVQAQHGKPNYHCVFVVVVVAEQVWCASEERKLEYFISGAPRKDTDAFDNQEKTHAPNISHDNRDSLVTATAAVPPKCAPRNAHGSDNR